MLEHFTQEIMYNAGFALDDFECIPECKQQGGSSHKIAPAFSAYQASMLIKAQQLFGKELNTIVQELNGFLIA